MVYNTGMGIDYNNDLIAAISTAPGESAIAAVRISGGGADLVLGKLFSRKPPYRSRYFYHGQIIRDGLIIDDVMAVYLKGPHTYTGQDTAEIYCHGGHMASRRVLEACLAAGCRLAEPGEFSKRAFLNGRLDLSEAEAVSDLICATTEAAAQTAVNQVAGRLKAAISGIRERLLDFLASIEATVDYPEDDLDGQVSGDILRSIGGILEETGRLLVNAEFGKVYREGIRASIIGRPNVGKSSLLNAFLGEDMAIVTDIPGTTRDALHADISIRGVSVLLTDTAGIRESTDAIEQLGIERSMRAIENAQIVLLILDSSHTLDDEDIELYNSIKNKPHIVVKNKSDLPSKIEGQLSALGIEAIPVSAKTGQGIEQLENAILDSMLSGTAAPRDAILSNVRHIDAVRRAHEALLAAKGALEEGLSPDLAATDIRAAWHALGEVSGGTVDEDVVQRIFAKFCVGK